MSSVTLQGNQILFATIFLWRRAITSMHFISYVFMDFIPLTQTFICFHQNWTFCAQPHKPGQDRTALELMFSSLYGYPVLMAWALLAQQWTKPDSLLVLWFFFFFNCFYCQSFCCTYRVCFVSLILFRRNTLLLAFFKRALFPLFSSLEKLTATK